jgi:general secretion pathway protein E
MDSGQMSDPSAASASAFPNPRTDEFIEGLKAHLIARGVLDEFAALRAQRAQRQSGERFDLVLTRLGLVSEEEMTRQLADYLGLPLIEEGDLPDYPLLADRLELQFLLRNRVLPISDQGSRMIVATSDPFNTDPVTAIGYLVGRPVEARLMVPAELEQAVERLYGRGAAAVAQPATTEGEQANDEDVRRLADLASEAPVIRLVNDLIARAVELRASDVHIEPREDSVRVRYRLDGMLHTVETLPLSMQAAVTSRIKIMAQLNIAERRLPQDGRIKQTVRGKEIDLRVSTMPTMQGESVVLRILDRSSVQLDFAALGFSGPSLDTLKALLAQPNGIILVTGPTGSGKTTTLYTALNSLNSPEQKLFTVEDPIEYQLTGVNQIQVQPRIGLTFAHALRSILRQDPDIIMVGEIRDLETAQMAIQAALTGHLVLSTLHTNSAASSITRLLDMGVPDYLLASTVTGVLAQRLVRKLCPLCSVPAEGERALVEKLGGRVRSLDGLRARRGCPKCRQTGFQGRTTVSELLVMDAAVRRPLLDSGTDSAIEAAAIAGGMVTMFEDGLTKALRGETTIEEVLRVTRMN